MLPDLGACAPPNKAGSAAFTENGDSTDKEILMNRLLLLSAAVLLTACGSGETDKIGRASTVFNMLGKNDRIEVEGFDDPDVQGVACYISYAKKGGLKETVNLEQVNFGKISIKEILKYTHNGKNIGAVLDN